MPVVENGEVIALLDIAKCLYDAIARMERAAEKGKAIAAAVEGVEKNWGTSLSGWWIMFSFVFNGVFCFFLVLFYFCLYLAHVYSFCKLAIQD